MLTTPGRRLRITLSGLLLFAFTMPMTAAPQPQGHTRLQELLYGEALFLSQQGDYLSAINRLQMAEAQGKAQPVSAEAKLLLARLKLAYGMHLEASFDLHALLGEDVPPPVKNRAWYELATSFYHKGYHAAAIEALDNIHGSLPADLAGDYQLLRATVLMALNRNTEAALELMQWQGDPELAAYAHYNRGIALVRADDYREVVPALEKATDMPAKGEERLALRDKARLALGYAFAREEKYIEARDQLEAVRDPGPFSNRALLALGWIAYKQGRGETALVSWTQLRGRSAADPAVLETLLVVPGVHRELHALETAGRDYEAAVAAYNTELQHLQEARELVQSGETVSRLLQHEQEKRGVDERLDPAAIRFFGPLLASRNFAELQQDHGELNALRDSVDNELHEIEALPDTKITAQEAPQTPRSISPDATRVEEPEGTATEQSPGSAKDIQLQREWVQRDRKAIEDSVPGIPQLPEIESPSQRPLKPLPEHAPPSQPSISNYLRNPPEPEFFGLPDSEILELPHSGEFFHRPQSGEFFRRPGQDLGEDYAYPDSKPHKRRAAATTLVFPLDSLSTTGSDTAGFDPGAVPVGEALRELAGALSAATERIALLGGAYDEDNLEQRIAALRARILTLRSRIDNAIALHENYTREIALRELDRRQALLENLLEQASLELAKTYDQRVNH